MLPISKGPERLTITPTVLDGTNSFSCAPKTRDGPELLPPVPKLTGTNQKCPLLGMF